MADRKPPRTFIPLLLKWRGPDGLTSRRIVQIDSAMLDLPHDEQVERMRKVALQVKPNPTWRLTAYDLGSQGRVDLE